MEHHLMIDEFSLWSLFVMTIDEMAEVMTSDENWWVIEFWLDTNWYLDVPGS